MIFNGENKVSAVIDWTFSKINQRMREFHCRAYSTTLKMNEEGFIGPSVKVEEARVFKDCVFSIFIVISHQAIIFGPILLFFADLRLTFQSEWNLLIRYIIIPV